MKQYSWVHSQLGGAGAYGALYNLWYIEQDLKLDGALWYSTRYRIHVKVFILGAVHTSETNCLKKVARNMKYLYDATKWKPASQVYDVPDW